MNVDAVAQTFQPNVNHLFFNILGSGKAWIIIFIAPIVALIPDFILVYYKATFHPNPINKLMRLQSKTQEA